MIEFEKSQDYLFVQQQGLWVVADHYLIVQRWRPNFDPYDEGVRKMAVWIRMPGVPREFYTHKDLWRMGNMVGKTLKIDESSLRISGQGQLKEITDRGRFARICVEIDLSKNLLSKFRIGQRQLYIGYEGLHLVCFLCGQYGHRKDQCQMNPDNLKKVEEAAGGVDHCSHSNHNQNEAEPKEGIEKSQEVDGFGSWMTIQRRNFKRPAQYQKSKEGPVRKEKSNPEENGIPAKDRATGSRFGPLEGESEERALRSNDNANVADTSNSKIPGELSQPKKSQGGKKKKNSTENEAKGLGKKPISSVPQENSRGSTQKKPLREAILIERGRNKGSMQVETGSGAKVSTNSSGVVLLQRNEMEISNQAVPGHKENPHDGSSADYGVCLDERAYMTLDDITNAMGISN
ncbi:uncharacterized protein LOC133317649 [Gastrolobium bilobum]|uniref:uncharacterized protein LOC133317649 n=1 Tax=Gastrolobium bilobum TaxID=150636 RepID=UPI002AB164FF|nr:uncharacterized protein LOC133317649 [Gastrolobium bilobum]